LRAGSAKFELEQSRRSVVKLVVPGTPGGSDEIRNLLQVIYIQIFFSQLVGVECGRHLDFGDEMLLSHRPTTQIARIVDHLYYCLSRVKTGLTGISQHIIEISLTNKIYRGELSLKDLLPMGSTSRSQSDRTKTRVKEVRGWRSGKNLQIVAFSDL